jgi:hypothetical protein
MSEIQKYIKILNINCPRCLDTKILWKGRDNVFWARIDGRGDYDVMHCDKCSGGGWNRCSHTTDIYARGIHAFHVADGEWHVLETLRPMVKPYLDHIAQMEAERIRKEEADRIQEEADRIREKEDRIREKEEADHIREKEEADRIREEADSSDSSDSDDEDRIQQEIDRIQKEKEKEEEDRIQKEKEKEEEDRIQKEKEKEEEDRIQKEKEKEDDENPMPLWAYYKNDDFDKKIKSTDIAVEIGKIAERMYEVIKLSCGDITELTSLIKELKMDLKSSMESSTSNKTELKQIPASEGRFKVTYVKLYISNQMESTSCSCLEWCGFNTKESHFSLQYTVYQPRNMAAKKRCDEDMSKLVIL